MFTYSIRIRGSVAGAMAPSSPTERRLRSLASHVTSPNDLPCTAATLPAATSACSSTSTSSSSGGSSGAPPPPKLLDDEAVKSFIMKGWMSISPEQVGLPRATMQTIYDKMSALHDDKNKKIGENSHSAVPEIHDVMAQPAVVGALQSLLGKDYSLHPHTFTHIKDDVGADQDWVSRQVCCPEH